MLSSGYFVIEGNIGAGKTTLARMIAEEFNAQLVLEEFAENTFLPQFYKDPERFAFPLEMSFMAERYQQLKKNFESAHKNKLIISDYLFDKSLLFAKVNLKKEELRLFENFFNLVKDSIPKPDLIIFLQKNVSDLKKNIAKRGREYEKEMDPDYLQKIKSSYDNFLGSNKSLKKIIIPSDELDFVLVKKDYDFIIDQIKNSLKGNL